MRLEKNKSLKGFAKQLRQNATKQENKLWYNFLSKHKNKFCRQFIIGNYIADFYCISQKLIIEIDGGQHYTEEQLVYDKNRTEFFKRYDIRVIRFTNTDIDKRFDQVCEEIELVIQKLK